MLPLKITERRSLIGNSGLVISVGFENVGAVMSTRLLSGASGSLSSPAAASCASARLRDRLGAPSWRSRAPTARRRRPARAP